MKELLELTALELGAAIQAAACSDAFTDLHAAVRAMGQPIAAVYHPGENQARYEALYRHYQTLHDYFGRGGSDVMKRLKAIRTKIKG